MLHFKSDKLAILCFLFSFRILAACHETSCNSVSSSLYLQCLKDRLWLCECWPPLKTLPGLVTIQMCCSSHSLQPYMSSDHMTVDGTTWSCPAEECFTPTRRLLQRQPVCLPGRAVFTFFSKHLQLSKGTRPKLVS